MARITMSARAWPAPAKLNRFLHITGRRADGYHELQTVFQFLDFGDELSFTPRGDGVLALRDPLPGVALENDLCLRAAQLLQRAVGAAALGADIAVSKRIPLGGGLGGGSSDAATTLVALNALWNTGLPPDELASLGRSLGADVPVFVRGRAAWAEGVGERLTPMTLDEPWFLVVTPSVQVSTAEIFSAPDLKRDCAPVTEADFQAGRCGNVCEAVTFARYPVVREVFTQLSRFGTARMSGTGASCFVAFVHEAAAREAAQSLPASWPHFVARGLNHSPLFASV